MSPMSHLFSMFNGLSKFLPKRISALVLSFALFFSLLISHGMPAQAAQLSSVSLPIRVANPQLEVLLADATAVETEVDEIDAEKAAKEAAKAEAKQAKEAAKAEAKKLEKQKEVEEKAAKEKLKAEKKAAKAEAKKLKEAAKAEEAAAKAEAKKLKEAAKAEAKQAKEAEAAKAEAEKSEAVEAEAT